MKWIHAKDEVPEVEDTYDSMGNVYAESRSVLTDLGIGVYRTTREDHSVGNWYILASDPCDSCRCPENVRYWMPMPECDLPQAGEG